MCTMTKWCRFIWCFLCLSPEIFHLS
jgi:hypothetical protein